MSDVALLALLSVVAAATSGGGSGSTHHVRKTAFSRRNRVLFVAGLEGTGHHMWGPTLEASCPERLCAADADVSLALFNARAAAGGGWVIVSSVFLGDLDESEESRRRGTRTVLEGLRRAASVGGAPSLLALNTLAPAGGLCRNSSCSGMMSYPNFDGVGRALHYPDLHRLAYWGEMVGADLRVVVMVRNARDMLASTVVRRHFAAWGKQGATLTNAAAALAQQLGLIDPRFFACVPYEGFEVYVKMT